MKIHMKQWYMRVISKDIREIVMTEVIFRKTNEKHANPSDNNRHGNCIFGRFMRVLYIRFDGYMVETSEGLQHSTITTASSMSPILLLLLAVNALSLTISGIKDGKERRKEYILYSSSNLFDIHLLFDINFFKTNITR